MRPIATTFETIRLRRRGSPGDRVDRRRSCVR
jgi:hypothetical protein